MHWERVILHNHMQKQQINLKKTYQTFQKKNPCDLFHNFQFMWHVASDCRTAVCRTAAWDKFFFTFSNKVDIYLNFIVVIFCYILYMYQYFSSNIIFNFFSFTEMHFMVFGSLLYR